MLVSIRVSTGHLIPRFYDAIAEFFGNTFVVYVTNVDVVIDSLAMILRVVSRHNVG